jgi:hypothetical protein
MKVTFNGAEQLFGSVEALGHALDRFDLEPQFELWISVGDGPSMAMLRNSEHAWLMYLRFNGDSGFVSRGTQSNPGTCRYTLSNGEVGEYPIAWCIDIEQCYKAIAYFFVNEGAQPQFVSWQQS